MSRFKLKAAASCPVRDCVRLRSLCLFKQNIRRSRRQAAAASCRTQFATAFAYAHSVYSNKTYADRGGKLRRQAAAPSSRLRSLTLTLFIQTKHTPIAAASCRFLIIPDLFMLTTIFLYIKYYNVYFGEFVLF